MKSKTVRFNNTSNVEFIKAIRANVNDYFTSNNISKFGNVNMVLKTIFMLFLYFTPLAFLISGVIETIWLNYFLWFVMSLGMSGIGLSVMHDANHGSYSKNKKVNRFIGFVINFLGGYHINWKIQHNVLHHSFTNIEGFDEDIDVPVMRFSPTQPHKKAFRFQAFYAPFFYGLLTVFWVLGKDVVQLITYNKRKLLKSQDKSFVAALTEIIVYKLLYVVLTLVLPLMATSVPVLHVVLGYLMMHFLCGLILALIFQSAHVLEETDFFEPDEKGSVENNWAIHQLRTTANFANGGRIFSWLIGGLNYQIEHHLFPHICHVHYAAISGIVEETARQYNVPYHKHKTFYGALKSHFSLLNRLGTNKI